MHNNTELMNLQNWQMIGVVKKVSVSTCGLTSSGTFIKLLLASFKEDDIDDVV